MRPLCASHLESGLPRPRNCPQVSTTDLVAISVDAATNPLATLIPDIHILPNLSGHMRHIPLLSGEAVQLRTFRLTEPPYRPIPRFCGYRVGRPFQVRPKGRQRAERWSDTFALSQPLSPKLSWIPGVDSQGVEGSRRSRSPELWHLCRRSAGLLHQLIRAKWLEPGGGSPNESGVSRRQNATF